MADEISTEPAQGHIAAQPTLPRSLRLDWLITFALGCALYVATCAPDVLMGDSAVPQLRVPSFPPTPAGHMTNNLVQVHPFYLLAAKPFTWIPVGTLAYRVNLASAFFGALTLAFLFVSVRVLTDSRWAAAIGTLSVGLGHTFWAYSVIAETYTLVTACISAEVLLLLLFARTNRVRWFLLAGLVNGLSISNHMLGSLSLPIYAVLAFVWWRRDKLTFLGILGWIGLWFVGASIYLVIILRAMLETGQIVPILWSATTGTWPAANVSVSLSMIGKVAAYFLLQYPTLLFILAVPALWVAPVRDTDRVVKWAIVALAALHFVFAARYPIRDQYSFFIPCYALLGILVGLGAWAFIRRVRWLRWAGIALTLLPIGVYAVLPELARRMEYNPFTRALPYRDPYDFWLKPWQQGNYGVRRYCTEAFEILPKDALLFADPTPGCALIYVQHIEGKRKDVRFVWSWKDMSFEAMLHATFPPRWRRPVYITSTSEPYAPAVLLRDCKIVPEGILYRVDPPRRYPKGPWK
jgi:hypothetical protein